MVAGNAALPLGVFSIGNPISSGPADFPYAFLRAFVWRNLEWWLTQLRKWGRVGPRRTWEGGVPTRFRSMFGNPANQRGRRVVSGAEVFSRVNMIGACLLPRRSLSTDQRKRLVIFVYTRETTIVVSTRPREKIGEPSLRIVKLNWFATLTRAQLRRLPQAGWWPLMSPRIFIGSGIFLRASLNRDYKMGCLPFGR